VRSDLSTPPKGVYTPVKLAHTPCANVTPRGQWCVAASYVCLLLILKVILYTWKMHNLAFCGSQICKKSKFSGALSQTPLGELTALPGLPSCWLPQEPYLPLSALWASSFGPSSLARVRPLSQVHTPWGKFLDKSL